MGLTIPHTNPIVCGIVVYMLKLIVLVVVLITPHQAALNALDAAYHAPACFDMSTQHANTIPSTHCEYN